MHLRSLTLCAALACAGIGAARPAFSAPQRGELSLAGSWQHATTQDPSDTAPTTGWKEAAVPDIAWQSPEGGTHYIWWQKDIQIPASFAGQRVFIDLRGARFKPRVYVDGKFIGGYGDGFSPVEVEITDAVKPGQTHKIAIRCQDRGAYFPGGFVLKQGMNADDVRGKTLNPVGGHRDTMGLWDRVLLKSTPQQYIDAKELVIVTSTRKGTLSLSGKALAAPAGATVSAKVLDGDKTVLNIPAAPVNADGAFSLISKFDNAEYWSPENPKLYHVVVSLQPPTGGEPLDCLTQRFGFKEIWTEGSDIYINGVKRHLLASSTWPNPGFEKRSEIFDRVRNIRACNTIAFRLHTRPWQEDWLDAADETGLLIVDETATYTDGDGFYGYKDDRFWANYRTHLEGIIRRDRNHPSLAMWSVGNEILFMGMQRYDDQLPKKLGDLARFAKTIDATHPYTFEADRDPDGAYDVIGLHYPHEMPNQRAYPNITDWLGSRKDAEAAGGMLGQHSGDFFWDRKKPLYIGEYLWVPQGDHSCSTIWSGDEAFLNRDEYHALAQRSAFRDQSIAYRRAGVSGICPWSAFSFGGIQDPKDPYYINQYEYDRPLAAFWRNRGLRFFSGETAKLSFDVFNDTDKPADMDLTVRIAGDPSRSVSQKLTLNPGDYKLLALQLPLPTVSKETDLSLESILTANGKLAHKETKSLRMYARQELKAPKGFELLVFDPSGKWPGAAASLTPALQADARKTILLIAPGALSLPSSDVPLVGGASFETPSFLKFINAGGRAVVLEQPELSALGLGLATRESLSTMTFPIQGNHPMLDGIRRQDLSYWRDDNIVANKQIIRPTTGGARGITVSGGPDWLDNAPIVETTSGKGRVVLMQALVGAKLNVEPAAAHLLQNAVNYLAESPAPNQQAVAVVNDSADFAKCLNQLGLITTSDASAKPQLLILNGGGEAVTQSADRIEKTLDAGGTVYWHAPTPAAFNALRSKLSASSLKVREADYGISLATRDSSLLLGISREDIFSSTVPDGWGRNMNLLPKAARSFVEPEREIEWDKAIPASQAKLDGAKADQMGAAIFDRKGAATFKVSARKAGIYQIQLTLGGTMVDKKLPSLLITANDVDTCWFDLDSTEPKAYTVMANLQKGENTVTLRFLNGAEWGGGRQLTLQSIRLSHAPAFGSEIEVLTLPAAVASWKARGGRVVIDGVNWDQPKTGQADPLRFASALLGNLGASFKPSADHAVRDNIPLDSLKLIGESGYFGRTSDQLDCRNNAILETPIQVSRPGQYSIRVTAFGSPCKKVYPMVRLLIDGKEVAYLETNSPTPKAFNSKAFPLAAGRHTLRVIYDNDMVADGEDRNLFLKGVEFVRQ